MSDKDHLEWLIVGGGIHGVHLAARLIGEGGVDPKLIGIVDPAEELLSRWRTCTKTTGMSHLRSPSVHHLERDPLSMQRLAGKRRNRKNGVFAYPYDRPSLEFFNTHCDRVIESHGLKKLHIRARATHCRVRKDCVKVTVEHGKELKAAQVILAMGAGEHLEWPSWAPKNDSNIQHIFAPDFCIPSKEKARTVAVVGGGISAGQMAIRLVRAGAKVHMISRHGLRQHQFDSDPGWLGPKLMTRFEKEPDVVRRRSMITGGRYSGSVPPDIHRGIRRFIHQGKIEWHEKDVKDLKVEGEISKIEFTNETSIKVDRVLLATGFDSARPGGKMVDELIKTASLPCAPCGYPHIDRALRWHPRVIVTGPLAELEIGPVSRNIAGARRAADRILLAMKQKSEGVLPHIEKASSFQAPFESGTQRH